SIRRAPNSNRAQTGGCCDILSIRTESCGPKKNSWSLLAGIHFSQQLTGACVPKPNGSIKPGCEQLVSFRTERRARPPLHSIQSQNWISGSIACQQGSSRTDVRENLPRASPKHHKLLTRWRKG